MKDKILAVIIGILGLISGVIIPIAIVFVIGFGVSSCMRYEKPHYYDSGYVINKNSKKIHAATCPHIGYMSKENKLFVDDYEMAKKYYNFEPCKDCLPSTYYEYSDK